MPSSSKNILKAIRQLINENTLENAQSLAGLIDVRLDDGLSDKYTDENYRYKDVGYIAGARKEQAQASILTAKKEGLQVFATDIDWDALEEDSRIAADTITKKNVFGQVDWDRLKAGGMHGNVGYLIKRIYAAVALKPDVDDAETRKLYVVAIQNLRQIFEKCKTYEDALNELVALSKLLNTYRNMVKGEDGKSTLNYDSLVAHALGKKFKSWVFKSGNKALHESKKMAIDDWSWLEPSDKTTTSAPKKKPFQLEAAADINRIGGAKVDIKSTEQFKDAFGLKAIQSGNWVLKDKESIEFHVQRSAEAMSDMADVTGIPANLLGFGGRLGLAFGARGKGGALAHYEPVQRVINITKMKGGGSLGHEYFHALDNIIRDLIHQKDNGAAGYFATENPNLLPDGLVKEAFSVLRQAMKVSARNSRMMTITEDIRNKAKGIVVSGLIDNLRLKNVDLSTPSKLIEALANHAGNRYTGVYRDKEISKQGVYVVLACMIHLGMITGNENEVEFPVLWEQSDFEKAAIRLDEGKQGKYWSKTLEMAARAYSAYLQDRLEQQGRVNDYLAYSTKGGNNRVGEVAYPQGKEREAINAAFDKLFLAIKKEQVFEKAVANKDLMDSIFGNTSANGVIKAIRTLLANNTYENANQLASLVGLTLEDPNKKIEVIEHTTKKGKVIRGVVRTDLSYAEAKAIDEYTFKKDGGWFIREKYLTNEPILAGGDTPTDNEPQSAVIESVQTDNLVNDADNNIEGLTRKFKPAAKKYKNPEIRLEPKEGAKLLKHTLTKLFPNTKFKVNMSRGTAYGSVSVSWVDGASYDLVDVIAQHFKGSGFDGMSDSTYYLNAINEDGKVVDYGLGYVSLSRGYSREFLEKLQTSFSDMLQNMIKQEGVTIKGDGFNAYFDAKERWTQDKINEAKISHSTGKYNFGNAPQVANDDDFSLQSQTEAERLANELRIKAAEQAKQKVEEQARLKAQADKELNDFRLSGSSAPSDIAASYGQGDMFVQTRGQQKKGENNVPSTSNALESDIKPTSTPYSQQGIKNSNDDESGQSGRMARPPVNGLDARGGSERDSGLSLPKNDGISLGIGSDTSVSDGAGERGVGASNTTTESGGSNSTNESRTPINRKRDSAVVRTATTTGSVTQTAKEAEQLKAEGTPTQWGDAENIDKALPYLLPEQRGDVAKLEKRLIEENKNGMLFTNGTGTGKTFTGLGAVKRFANAGKKNILIVSMNDKIIRDFIKSAKSLNLDVHQLDGITDNGKDKIVATTYANMAQNNTLGMRDWDLIIVDEAHNLMQGEKGENTNALAKLRALSGHYAGFSEWVKMRHADKDPKPVGESPETGLPIYNQDEVAAWEAFKKPLGEQWKKTWTEQPKGRTKVVFLTATPFSYVKTLDWAEGYLFDFVPPADKFSNKTDAMGSAYNSGDPVQRFYMSNFGYKMRNNRLTRPDARVDVGILERKFAEKLKTEGAMSGRELSVPFDYDRKFVKVKSAIGEKIDEGFNYLWNTKDKDGKSKYSNLLRFINKRFDYLARLQLLEAIKAKEAIEQIKKHLALGRKVIVFHDYNVGGATNPFIAKGLQGDDSQAVEAQYEEFQRERPDLINLKLDIPAPLVTLKKAFPNALMFNGTVSKGQRNKNAELFNSDDSGSNVMIAQSDAAATGISFHDTTGKHQRVIINIGMPTKPAKLRQTEGRIYRVGQASNAIQRYLTTGTDWERSAFAQKIAERAETVDNLAQGEAAMVSIKDALVRAYEEAEYFEPSENDGIGGKAYDEENARINKLTPFERAKSDYWVKQKVTAKRNYREGKEWYATPEPVGLFMVNLAGAHSGDDILEPSAGDGAIGRYMPSDASVTFIEPSESLASRARMNNTNANVIVDGFEEHGTNNKYDAIVMNPPFGQGGSIAIKHLVKAFEHLRDGGRVVALLPVGKMDELIAKYQADGYFEKIYTVAEFTLPSSTFENAGTRVNTKIHVFEKHENKADAPQGVIVKDLSHYDDISRLFDAIENINIKPRKPRLDEALAEYGIQVYPERSKYIVTGEGLKRMDIKSLLFTPYDKPNADGDYVEKYNYSKQYLRLLKENNTATTEQFNQGLSGNNLPIKYQDPRSGFKHNVWDGFGEKPYWLTQALQYGKKLEDFAVEKPVYDAVSDNDPKAIISAIRTVLNDSTPENIQALADAAGLSIKKPLSAPVAPVITQSTAQASKTFGEQATENIPQPQTKTTPILNGFTDNMTTLNAGKAKTVLSVKINYGDLGILTRGEFVEQAAQKSIFSKHEIETQRIRAKKDHPDAFYTSRGYMRMTEKTVLSLDGFIITQTEHDYSQYLLKKQGNHFDDIGTIYDSIANNDPKEIIAAIRKLMANNTPENARALAEAAGVSIEKPSPSDDLIPNFLKPYTPPTKNERAIESPEVEELAAFYAKELGRGSVNSFHINFAKAVLSKDVYSLEHLANGSNDVAKSVFTKATGVKLPKQQGQTWKALLEWAGVSQESDNLKKARSNVKYEYEKAKREYNLSDKTLEDFKESTLLKIADGYDKIINANKMYWLVNSLGQGYSLSEKGKKGVVGMSNLRNLIAALIEEYKASQLINAAKESALSIKDQSQANASGLFGDADTIEGQNNTANEYEIFSKHKNAIAMDIVKEIKRVEAIKAAARHKGKYSSAEHNRKKIAQKWGVNPVGWGTFDKMFGYALEVTIRGAFSGKSVKYTDQDIHDGAIRFINEWLASQNNRLDDTNHFDDIGGFSFEPMVSVDATMQAIKKLMAENTLDNARYLAMIAGLKLKEDEPSQDLDMFGEPINQDFDLFGEPIQDGEESPVEELPRLAVVELPLSKLTLSEDVPQFKSGADGESGVVEALGGKFDRTGVAPIQVWERTDGRLEIISGRHRTDLARRSGERTIPAQVHKESEGFTAKQAMMLDAELNIRDGQGKVKDYVDYFTHSEISEEEADRRGLIARSIGQRAFIIASKGSEELKNQHRNEIISDQAAAEISSIAPNNSAMQAVGLRVLQDNKPLNNALNAIRAVGVLTREKGQEPDTFDLFGFDDSALKEAEAMARIASRKQRQIAEQLNAIKGAVKNPKLAAKHGVVVENEADALAKVKTMTAQKARWDNWPSHADLLAEVRAELNAKFDSLLDDEDDYYWLCQEELAI